MPTAGSSQEGGGWRISRDVSTGEPAAKVTKSVVKVKEGDGTGKQKRRQAMAASSKVAEKAGGKETAASSSAAVADELAAVEDVDMDEGGDRKENEGYKQVLQTLVKSTLRNQQEIRAIGATV